MGRSARGRELCAGVGQGQGDGAGAFPTGPSRRGKVGPDRHVLVAIGLLRLDCLALPTAGHGGSIPGQSLAGTR